MQIKTVVLLFILIAINLKGQSKAIMQIDYQVQIASDSLQPEQKVSIDYTLLLNETSSLFFNKDSRDYYTSQSGKNIVTNKGNIISYGKPPRVNASVYKNGKDITAVFPVGRDLISFPEPNLHWTLLPDTKNIQNMRCQLAKTTTENNQVFYAWFTSDIPFSEGPFRFKGLSGTILELFNSNKTIQASTYSIKKSSDFISPIPYKKVIKVDTKNKFFELRKNYYDNPSAYNTLRIFDANGNSITDRYNDRLKNVNTFID